MFADACKLKLIKSLPILLGLKELENQQLVRITRVVDTVPSVIKYAFLEACFKVKTVLAWSTVVLNVNSHHSSLPIDLGISPFKGLHKFLFGEREHLGSFNVHLRKKSHSALEWCEILSFERVNYPNIKLSFIPACKNKAEAATVLLYNKSFFLAHALL